MLFRVVGITGRPRVREQGVPLLHLSVVRLFTEQWRHLGPKRAGHMDLLRFLVSQRLITPRLGPKEWTVRHLDLVPCIQTGAYESWGRSRSILLSGPRLRSQCCYSADTVWARSRVLQVLPAAFTSPSLPLPPLPHPPVRSVPWSTCPSALPASQPWCFWCGAAGCNPYLGTVSSQISILCRRH